MTPQPEPLRSAQPDGGFTLIEVLVALALVSIMVGSLTTFFVGSLRMTSYQGEQQIAAQLALDGIEDARTLRGDTLIEGRAICSSGCPAAAAGVAPYLVGTERWDAPAVAGVAAALPTPTAADVVSRDDIAYSRYWHVGRCWQPKGGGACVNVPANPLHFYRLVVAVTWKDSRCVASICAFVTSALFNGDLVDPVFRTP
jgi:prepilin-type N-terminal cleavage/methylation domain-containing protein